jgi:hypothetical protein
MIQKCGVEKQSRESCVESISISKKPFIQRANIFFCKICKMLTDGFIVYNLAHTNQTIRSKCGSLRFLGAFSTREEAEAFV